MSDNVGECKCCDKLADDNERLRRELAEARAVLRRYGGHEDDCAGTAGYLDPRCTCGFSAALGMQPDQPPLLDCAHGSHVVAANGTFCVRCGEPITAPQPDAVDYKALYRELLYAVGSKFPGESRHETALRYIQQAEKIIGDPKQATADKSGDVA